MIGAMICVVFLGLLGFVVWAYLSTIPSRSEVQTLRLVPRVNGTVVRCSITACTYEVGGVCTCPEIEIYMIELSAGLHVKCRSMRLDIFSDSHPPR